VCACACVYACVSVCLSICLSACLCVSACEGQAGCVSVSVCVYGMVWYGK